MASKNNRSKSIGEGIPDGLNAIEQPVEELMVDTPEEVMAPMAAPSQPEFFDLTNHPDFVLQPNIPQIVLYRGDRLDLCKLRQSQFIRLTTNADAAKIVRRR